jgi:hypothetical protein
MFNGFSYNVPIKEKTEQQEKEEIAKPWQD